MATPRIGLLRHGTKMRAILKERERRRRIVAQMLARRAALREMEAATGIVGLAADLEAISMRTGVYSTPDDDHQWSKDQIAAIQANLKPPIVFGKPGERVGLLRWILGRV